ncbi:MAG: hypothetical protein AABX51_06145 [Nanoarchaeota archaeon]
MFQERRFPKSNSAFILSQEELEKLANEEVLEAAEPELPKFWQIRSINKIIEHAIDEPFGQALVYMSKYQDNETPLLHTTHNIGDIAWNARIKEGPFLIQTGNNEFGRYVLNILNQTNAYPAVVDPTLDVREALKFTRESEKNVAAALEYSVDQIYKMVMYPTIFGHSHSLQSEDDPKKRIHLSLAGFSEIPESTRDSLMFIASELYDSNLEAARNLQRGSLTSRLRVVGLYCGMSNTGFDELLKYHKKLEDNLGKAGLTTYLDDAFRTGEIHNNPLGFLWLACDIAALGMAPTSDRIFGRLGINPP